MPTQESIKSHLQLDWLISNLRWLPLVGVALVMFLDVFVEHANHLDLTSLVPQILIFVFAVVFNIAVTFLLARESPPLFLPIVTVTVYILLTIGLISSSGGLSSPLLLFALFPVLTAARGSTWRLCRRRTTDGGVWAWWTCTVGPQ